MWKSIAAAPADSILGLTEAFKTDTNPDKVNLGMGVYMNDAGITPVLACVKKAEQMLLGSETTKSYLPISGDPAYAACVQDLIFGPDSEVITTKRAATAHAPGGTGALRIGAELIKLFQTQASIWVSTPTWANHKGIFKAAGFTIKDYPYYNQTIHGLHFDEMLDTLRQVPAGDVVLLHACCHNPSGVDLDPEHWAQIGAIAKEVGWIPFLDFAYQGFGTGVEDDRAAVEAFAAAQIDFFVASSYSKNFGLYNERTGAITVVSPSEQESVVAMSHLKATVRVCYSNPPAHGGLVTKIILSDPALTKSWRTELAEMCNRIVAMRNAFVDGLAARGVDQDFSFIKDQRGMFSFSGLQDDTVAWLQKNKSIYIVGGGRINLAGLTSKNIDYVCDSIAEALHS